MKGTKIPFLEPKPKENKELEQVPEFHQKNYTLSISRIFSIGLGFYARPDYNINISERMKNIEYKVKNIEFLGVEAEYEVEDNEEPKKLLVVSSTKTLDPNALLHFFLAFRLASTVPMGNLPGTF